MKIIAMFTGMLLMMGFNYLLKGSGRKLVKLKIFLLILTLFYSVSFIKAVEEFIMLDKVLVWLNSMNETIVHLTAYAGLIIFALLVINLFKPLSQVEMEVRKRSAKNKYRNRKEA